MGHNAPFDFVPNYVPAANVQQNLCGTPGIIGMSILDASLSIFDDVSLKAIDDKSKKLQAFFVSELQHAKLLDLFDVISPAIQERGSQIALVHDDAYAICQAWIEAGVIADFRAPNVLRVGFAPLYLRFEDISNAVRKLKVIMAENVFKEVRFENRQSVT